MLSILIYMCQRNAAPQGIPRGERATPMFPPGKAKTRGTLTRHAGLGEWGPRAGPAGPGGSAGRQPTVLGGSSERRSGSLGAVLRLQTIVMARIATTTPSDSSTGILITSISIILAPMNTSTTARP